MQLKLDEKLHNDLLDLLKFSETLQHSLYSRTQGLAQKVVSAEPTVNKDISGYVSKFYMILQKCILPLHMRIASNENKVASVTTVCYSGFINP